jgi:response regulator RpfG family c-di-GMP phosphodiesterase
MDSKTINVLYVDDLVNNLTSFRAAFRRYFTVFTANSAKEAEAILNKKSDIHVLITDQRMPTKLGTELLADAVKKYPNQIRILLTAFITDDIIKEAENRGQLFGSMEKPWDETLLKELIIAGYDVYYQKILQQQRVLKLKQMDKEIIKMIKKKKKNKR